MHIDGEVAPAFEAQVAVREAAGADVAPAINRSCFLRFALGDAAEYATPAATNASSNIA